MLTGKARLSPKLARVYPVSIRKTRLTAVAHSIKAGGAHPSALASEEDRQHDYSLRPRSLAEFVGQERIKKVLAMSIAAARQRGEALDHVLFSAPPGLGKTRWPISLRVSSGLTCA